MRPPLSEFCVFVFFLVSSSLVLVVLVEVLMLDTRAAAAIRADSDNTRSMRLCPLPHPSWLLDRPVSIPLHPFPGLVFTSLG